MNPIPYGRQSISDEDIAEVVKTLRSDFLTQGPKIPEFEKAFAEYTGAAYAVAVSNGTAALHLAAMALNIGSGDKVITTPITFAASANCIRYTGGDVLFADIDEQSYLLDLYKTETLLKKDTSHRIKAIIPVDFTGNAVDLEAFRGLADQYGCSIIEDACHSPGGYFMDSKGQKQFCGNGRFADLSVFSFHPVKHIATAEGGMITTNNKDLYNRLIVLRTHGISKDPALMTENHGGWYYQMLELGYNYRLTDMQAALGLSQLKRAEDGLKRRRAIADRYTEALKSLADKVTTPVYDAGHAFHLYVIRVKNGKRGELYNHLKQHQIFAQVHYIPVHTMPYYREQGYRKGDFTVSEAFYEECLSIPMFPSLTDEEQNYVIDTIHSFFKKS